MVARRPDGQLLVHKLLSENPQHYSDAPLQGIRDLLGLTPEQPLPAAQIELVIMGTTVATNALLERRGDSVVFLTTAGFRDVLRIGYQHRPDIFAQQICLPEMLYEQVIEVSERYSATGEELQPVDRAATRQALQAAYDQGIRACAIALLHGYRYPAHEQEVAALAAEIGFEQISISHQVSPLIKLVSRGDTTVVDAYLSPLLQRYVNQVSEPLAGTPLMFMQSHGGLTAAHRFQGKDSLLSGPAGGIVGAVKTSQRAGFNQIIGFDMGGTSTDVSHFNGEYERVLETEVAGVRLRVPMLAIHTVAAGGGSILQFDGSRYRVGPASAGASPGPACYRQGGPLTVTDCNVMVGKLQPEFFPAVFGPERNLPLDRAVVQQQLAQLAAEIQQATGQPQTPEDVASGFLAIAVEKMANAIKKISLQRGHDVTEYTLCCFGGAGGQHACLIADALGMSQILIHPYAGVLSAYGMGLADLRVLREQTVEQALTPAMLPQLAERVDQLTQAVTTGLEQQQVPLTGIDVQTRVLLRYQGNDATLPVSLTTITEMQTQFAQQHQQRYGFVNRDRTLIVATVAVEGIGHRGIPEIQFTGTSSGTSAAPQPTPVTTVPLYTQQQWHTVPVYHRQSLPPDSRIPGPALIIEPTGTNVVEPGWQGQITTQLDLVLEKVGPLKRHRTDLALTTQPDPVLLEIFNHLFQAIAEQMGVTLQNTSASVNIRERLDFSCAVFDQAGELVANAPHIPVHLGSMGASVQAVIEQQHQAFQPGDVYVLNNPYNGGTHLPDVTVVTPVFGDASAPIFYVASRGHHADIGGITPGSMPPHSQQIDQEGVLIPCFSLVRQGQLQEEALIDLLTSGKFPARNPQQNLLDLQAQIAANQQGVAGLQQLVAHYGLPLVQAYMGYVQANAAAAVRRVIDRLHNGVFTYEMDNGGRICVQITVDQQQRTARIDFTGTSPQQPNNFNAPLAVTRAAVLYVFRTLVQDDIPLNGGCLQPLEIIVPPGSMLNPTYPAAVVAGNVETSQAVTNALYGALGAMAASQGTMNNFTFGCDRTQYYETICGGSGAGPGFAGTDAVQTHMTNSRLTDPEVLELNYPVQLDCFAIRAGSGGSGQYAGGNGVVRRIRFLQPMTAAILSGHRRVPPFGLQGGQPGAVGQNTVERTDGTVEHLDGTAAVAMQPGDVFVVETPGGGGFGA